MLPTPSFHHIHLNAVNPDASIAFYTRQFPSTSATMWGGHKALASPNDCLVLFNKVDAPPPTQPQSAIWHFGWHVADTRKTLGDYIASPEVNVLPLYSSEAGGSVFVSSDTWPSIGNTLGLNRRQIAEAQAGGVKPKGGGGFSYFEGPERMLVEIAGDYPAERFNHVHMWQEDPFCALLWYQKHLNAPVRAGFAPTTLSEADCQVPRGDDRSWPALNREGMFRDPRAGVEFGDVVLTWYANQGDKPLVSPLGQQQDHIGLGVADLDAWVAKLKGEGVRLLDGPYTLGDTRAAMIEGPSKEAIELVAV